MSKKQKYKLDDYEGKIPQENLLAMINSAVYLFNYKIVNIDWKVISEQVNQWLKLELESDDEPNLTQRYLQKFYQQMLNKLPEGDRYFLVDKINTVKAKDEELYVLVDWKYFPPSNPQKSSNWTKISLVDCDQIYKYLQIEENRKKYKAEIAKLPGPYQAKLEPYLDNEYLKQTIYKTQLNKTTLKSMVQKDEKTIQQTNKIINKQSDKDSDNNNKEMQKLQDTIKYLQKNQEQYLSQIVKLQQQNKIYEEEITNYKQLSSQLTAKLKQHSQNVDKILKSQSNKQTLDYSTYVAQ